MEMILTVAQSKRLVAKGVAAHPLVRRALTDGMVVIARGSTNGYVAEEVLGCSLDKPAFLTGRTLPRGYAAPRPKSDPFGDIVLVRGQRQTGGSLAEAVERLQAGDVFIKGANALDYANRQVGILIGHPQGGTIGAALPAIIARKAHLIVPVGLEKLVASDLTQMSEMIRDDAAGPGARAPEPLPSLWVVSGATIVTEIEAIQLVTGAQCRHLASGGIGGAEGGVRLLVSGNAADLQAARALYDSVAEEEPYGI
jgi:hypothetical protein